MNPGRCNLIEARLRFAQSTGALSRHDANLAEYAASPLIIHCRTLIAWPLLRTTLLLWQTAARTHWKINRARTGHATNRRGPRLATTQRPRASMIQLNECEDIDSDIFLKTFLKNKIKINFIFKWGRGKPDICLPNPPGIVPSISITFFPQSFRGSVYSLKEVSRPCFPIVIA